MGFKRWLKKASGVTGARRKIAKATGIPTTKGGRQRKVDRLVTKAATGGGCSLLLAAILVVVIVAIVW